MKANLVIQPGCEEGSLYCGDCRNLGDIGYFSCDQFPTKHSMERVLRAKAGKAKRCKQCLDADQNNDLCKIYMSRPRKTPHLQKEGRGLRVKED